MADTAKPEPKPSEILAAVNALSGQINLLDAVNRVSNQVASLDVKVTLVLQKEDAIMAAIDDVNAKLDAIVALVTKVGADLAAEIAAVGVVPAGGITAADATALMGRLQTISDQLTAIDATVPVPPTA